MGEQTNGTRLPQALQHSPCDFFAVISLFRVLERLSLRLRRGQERERTVMPRLINPSVPAQLAKRTTGPDNGMLTDSFALCYHLRADRLRGRSLQAHHPSVSRRWLQHGSATATCGTETQPYSLSFSIFNE
jgi:hypothetical protein